MNKRKTLLQLMLAVWVLLVVTLPEIAQAGSLSASTNYRANSIIPRATQTIPGSPVVTPSAGSSGGSLSVNPGNLTFNATSGTNPSSQSVSLSASSGTINYSSNTSYSGTGGWLSVSSGSGAVTAGQAQTVNFNVASNALPAGTYNATVTFMDTNQPSNTASVSVTLNVTANPTLSTQPANVSLVFNAAQNGSNPASLSVTLKANNGSLSYNASINYSSGQGWLSVNPSSGTIPNGGSQTLTVNATTGNLAVGTYSANIVFSSSSNSTVRVPVTFNITVPMPTPTPILVTSTTTVPVTTTATTSTTTVPTTSTTTQGSGGSNTTPAGGGGNNAPTASISGRVFINNAGASGIVVRLNGGNYRTTDGNGYFTFGSLAPDTYHLTVEVDPTQYQSLDGFSQSSDIPGYDHPVISVADGDNIKGADFNLASITPTTVATTSTTTTNSGGGGSVSTPTPTKSSGLGNCQSPTPLPNALSLNYCVSQSANDPNLFQVNFVLSNQTKDNLDLSHTLVFALQTGTTIQRTTNSQGQTNLSPNNSQISWSGLSLAPGQSASLSLVMTKAADNLTLIQSINVTGIDTTINSPFSAVLPAVLAQTSVGSDPIAPLGNSTPGAGGATGGGTGNTNTGPVNIPSGLPQTGASAVTQNNSIGLLAIWLFAIVVLSGLILLLLINTYAKKRR